MKVNFSINNTFQTRTKRNIPFSSGLNDKFIDAINHTNIDDISYDLRKKGIPANFKNNKVVAWCCNKVLDIVTKMNRRYRLNLALPKGIYVEDFSNLNIPNTTIVSFCTFAPSILRKNSREIIPAQAIFFNSNYDWTHIDEIADRDYASRFKSTGNFLDHFLNELAHVLHENNLQKKIGSKETVKKIRYIQGEEQVKEYKKKYGGKISQICYYALTDPLEAVACDMSRVIVGTLDPETLMPTRNPFVGTPYERLSILQRANIPDYSDEERPLNEILRNFWDGNFD